MRTFGLIGYPLGHSFSQPYFTEKFKKEHLDDCVYLNFPIPDITHFRRVLAENPGLEGLNVTIPYKRSVVAMLDHIDGGLAISACNCIKIKDGKTTGYNTDITGFERSLADHLLPVHQMALVLGNGGATEAVKYVLQQAGITVHLVSRKRQEGSTYTYDMLDRQIMEQHLLIINTTPVGMFPEVMRFPDIPYQYLTPAHYLYDLVYNPAKTIFLKKGEERGAMVKNGHDMLVIQAEESWKIWNTE